MEKFAFTPITKAFPEYTGNQASVIIKTNNGNIVKGMFYWNGGKPTFAAYGSEVLGVVAWAYR